MCQAYAWNWNLNTKILPPLIQESMSIQGGSAPQGPFSLSGDYILLHSVMLFDAIVAHVRFDGNSSAELVTELGRICEFEENDCVLCWTGAFPSFVLSRAPRATWKLIDSKCGLIKQGRYSASDVTDPVYKKPSDAPRTRLPELFRSTSKKSQ